MTVVDEAQLREVVAPLAGRGILLALQAIQEQFGFVPDGSMAVVAESENVTRAEVHGVLTYYADLRTELPAPCVVRVCVAEACQALGSRQVVADLAERGYDLHGRNVIDRIACEQVFCLGNCALGPSATVAGRIRSRVNAATLLQEAWEASR
jgi:formate dehydrogenase subunit gamma